MGEPTTTTIPPPDPPTKPPHPQPKTTSLPWGTLEDLLLACAVNRHGTTAWDAVSRELNHRRTTSLFTPDLCRLKYDDIKRRFSDVGAGDDGVRDDPAAVWLDELRRLRVAELKRDLHRYDLSIVSLQLKVKRLKEERDRSEKDENEREKCKNETEIPDPKQPNAFHTILPGNARRNDDSSNESNSADIKTEPVGPEPDRGGEPDRVEDSCNGSSNSKESGPGVQVDVVERVDSGELGESGAESRREGVKESSDVQSTASLGRREKEMRGISGNSSGDDNQSLGSKFSGGGGGGDGSDKVVSKGESKGFAGFLDVVRANRCGSIFDRRLESQETLRYKSLIKEHIDLGIIRKRVGEGRYTNCSTMFYRDFMLLVNNALVFFPRRSSEHKSATELRQLVTQHFQTHLNSKSCNPPKPEVDQPDHPDLKPKLAITGPVIACRKRSSIAGKLSSSEAEKKESLPVAVKTATVELLKKEGEKSSSTSFNAVTKKRTRDQSSGPRNPTSKNPSNRPSSTQKQIPRTISSKGEMSEAKKPSSGNSSSRSKQASRPNNDLLLDVLDSAVKRRIFGNGGGSGKNVNIRSDRNKDQVRGGSHNGGNKKIGTEKGKGREERERESPRNKNAARPPKKTVPAKRGRDSGRDQDAQAKKRSRR